MRDLIRAPIELAIGEPLVAVDDRFGFGSPFGLLREKLVKAAAGESARLD
jgi:hypothetical protein